MPAFYNNVELAFHRIQNIHINYGLFDQVMGQKFGSHIETKKMKYSY